jgi:uncharacterized membrane protein
MNELQIILMAALPITELQLAVPYAMTHFGTSAVEAFLLAALGNGLVFFPVYFGLEKVRALVEKYAKWCLKPIDAFVQRAERKLGADYKKYGAFALFLFIWIPFPFTGVWTATAGAVVLKIPFKQAALGVIGGMLSSGIIVTLITLSAQSLI